MVIAFLSAILVVLMIGSIVVWYNALDEMDGKGGFLTGGFFCFFTLSCVFILVREILKLF